MPTSLFPNEALSPSGCRTLIVYVAVAVVLPPPSARTTNVYGPSAVGVPLSRPFDESVTPAGGLPDWTFHVAVAGDALRGLMLATDCAESCLRVRLPDGSARDDCFGR